jgi:hypothetical protein
MERLKIPRSHRLTVDAGGFGLWAVSVAMQKITALWKCYLSRGQKNSQFPQDLSANIDRPRFALHWRRRDQSALHLALAEYDVGSVRP